MNVTSSPAFLYAQPKFGAEIVASMPQKTKETPAPKKDELILTNVFQVENYDSTIPLDGLRGVKKWVAQFANWRSGDSTVYPPQTLFTRSMQDGRIRLTPTKDSNEHKAQREIVTAIRKGDDIGIGYYDGEQTPSTPEHVNVVVSCGNELETARQKIKDDQGKIWRFTLNPEGFGYQKTQE